MDLQHLHNCAENRNTSLLRGLLRIIICLQEVHGKDEFFQAKQILVPQFRVLGTFEPNNLNAGGSAIHIHKNFFFDGAVISHVITCQGRDHTVSIHSGDSILVIVDVHFQADLTLRSLRERLRFFFTFGPVTLGHVELWLEISTSVNLCKADSTFGIRLSRMAMQERLLFSSFYPYVFEIAQPDFTRKDVTVNGVIRTCPEMTGSLLIFLWQRHVIFVAILMSSKILVNVPSRGFTASSCAILRVTCRHVLRMEGKHKERAQGDDKHSLADDPRAVCVTHKSVNHKKHTKFRIVLVILLFYCPFFLKRNVLFENVFFFFKTSGNSVFLSLIWIVFLLKIILKKQFFPGETRFTYASKIALRDWKLS